MEGLNRRPAVSGAQRLFRLMEFFEAVSGRRSVRSYRAASVPDALVGRALEAAILAPSAHNAQPWRFLVLTEAGLKECLADAMATEYRRDLVRDGLPSSEIDELVKASVRSFTSAPVLVLACLTMKDMDHYPDEARQDAECTMAVQSVAAALQNLLLAAHALGLAACWYCAPVFCPGTVKEALGLPLDLEPQALVTMGYAAEQPGAQARMSVEEVARFNYWR